MNLKATKAYSLVIAASIIFFSPVSTASAAKTETPLASCPASLNQEFRKLHSQEKVNLCSLYNGKPMLFVNTASHCGYTSQLKQLESLHQTYKEKGLVVVGFPSNDFNQAAKDEAKAASICFKNYGVSFTMLAPSKIKGHDANTVFKFLNEKTSEPKWNFNKYVFVPQSGVVKQFPSRTSPLNSDIESLIKNAL